MMERRSARGNLRLGMALTTLYLLLWGVAFAWAFLYLKAAHG
jgi:hypothetical protein